MKRDPVCGKQVDEKKASAVTSHQGERYVFCGPECKIRFDQNPERYIKQPQPQSQHAG